MVLTLPGTLVVIFLAVLILFVGFCLIFIKLSSVYPKILRSNNEKQFLDYKNKKSFPFPSWDDPWSVHLSVIVPAYNEEARLPAMLDECISFLETRCKTNTSFTYEIIIVSDGSKDHTVQVASQYSEKHSSDLIRVLALERNRGKGGAVQLGIQSARGAVVLFADADGATQFSDLTKLEDELQCVTSSNYMVEPEKTAFREGLICGSRSHLEGSDSVIKRSFFRNFLMHGFHFLVRVTAVDFIKDTQCGFKLMTRSSARKLFSSLHVRRWAFDVELLFIAKNLNITTREIPVNWTEIEGSKIVPVFSWIFMGLDLICIWFRYKIGAWKIKSLKED